MRRFSDYILEDGDLVDDSESKYTTDLMRKKFLN